MRTTELWVSAKPTPLPHHFTLFGLFALTGPNLHIIHFPHTAYRVLNLTSRRVVVSYISTSTANMARFHIILAVLASFIWCSSAQFGFFDQMFGGGGGQQHQEPQNVRSDSSWYQAQYEGGTSICCFSTHRIFIFSPQPVHTTCIAHVLQSHLITRHLYSLLTFHHSTMLSLPLPRHPFLRPLPAPLPLRLGKCRRQSRTRRRHRDLWQQGRMGQRRVCKEGRVGQERPAIRDE